MERFFRCQICSRVFIEAEINSGVEVNKHRYHRLIKLEGVYHNIHLINPAMHIRHHQRYGVNTVPGCFWCERERLEQEKLENEKQSESRQEEAVSQATGEPQDSHSPGGGATLETVSPAEEESDSPESNEPEPKPESEFGTMRFAFNRSHK